MRENTNPIQILFEKAANNEKYEEILEEIDIYVDHEYSFDIKEIKIVGYVRCYDYHSKISLKIVFPNRVDYPIYYDHNDSIAFDSADIPYELEEKVLNHLRYMETLNNLLEEKRFEKRKN